jgi:hypothetical protein
MRLETEGKTAWVTFSRERCLNAMSNACTVQLLEIARALKEHPDVRVICTVDELYRRIRQLEVENDFLSKVASSTQNQAFNALLFFYRQVLNSEFGKVERGGAFHAPWAPNRIQLVRKTHPASPGRIPGLEPNRFCVARDQFAAC